VQIVSKSLHAVGSVADVINSKRIPFHLFNLWGGALEQTKDAKYVSIEIVVTINIRHDNPTWEAL